MTSAAPPPISPAQPPLFLDYGGRRYAVTVPRFVTGRERGSCHLVLADNNISRQHAAVEFSNGAYFILDLGSRNGIGYGGLRIHRKQIVEGDQYELGQHLIAFSYRNG